jgi:hypothetical protein
VSGLSRFTGVVAEGEMLLPFDSYGWIPCWASLEYLVLFQNQRKSCLLFVGEEYSHWEGQKEGKLV